MRCGKQALFIDNGYHTAPNPEFSPSLNHDVRCNFKFKELNNVWLKSTRQENSNGIKRYYSLCRNNFSNYVERFSVRRNDPKPELTTGD